MIIAKNPIVAQSFHGMDNKSKSNIYKISDGEVSPKLILNMDHTFDGKLRKRGNYHKVYNLDNPHSLFSDKDELFCVSVYNGSDWLFRCAGSREIPIVNVMSIGLPMFYVAVNDVIYMSNKVWCGKYSHSLQMALPWGREYESDIAVMDTVDNSDYLMTLYNKSVVPMENLCLYSSRIWGSIANKLVYTQPFAYDWIRDENFISFPEPITMVYPSGNTGAGPGSGLYVASYMATWYLSGSSPEDMKLSVIGDGAIQGTVQSFVRVGDKTSTTIWMSRNGLRVGMGDSIIKLTDDTLKLDFPNIKAASFLRNLGGENPHYVVSSKIDDAGFNDSAIVEVFRKGQII